MKMILKSLLKHVKNPKSSCHNQIKCLWDNYFPFAKKNLLKAKIVSGLQVLDYNNCDPLVENIHGPVLKAIVKHENHLRMRILTLNTSYFLLLSIEMKLGNCSYFDNC